MKTSLVACLLALVPAAAQAAPAAGFEAQAVQAARAFAAPPPALRFAAHSPWQELLDKVLALGAFREADQWLPAGYGLEDIRGEKSGPHRADYVNVWGFTDSQGRFQPSFLTMVSEDWAVDAQGHWRITQWLFTLGLDGSISNAGWHLIVESRDNMVLDYQSQAKNPGDADMLAQRQALLERWTAFGRR